MITLLSYLVQAAASEPAEPVTTIDHVLKGIQEMETHGLALGDRIKELPDTGGSLINALSIHNDTTKLRTLVNKTAGYAKVLPLPISVEHSTKILQAISHLKPPLDETMKLTAKKKAAFKQISFGAPSIVKFDIMALRDSIVILGDALITVTPLETSDEAQTIKTDIEAIFDEAITAYR